MDGGSDGSPMRQPGKGGSSVLEKLAATTKPGTVPDQSRLLPTSDTDDRRMRATGADKHSSIMWIGAIFMGFFAIVGLRSAENAATLTTEDKFFLFLLCAAAIGLAVASTIAHSRAADRRRRAYASAIQWAEKQPFAVTGYESWLACDRPLLDLHLKTPFDSKLFTSAVHAIDPAIDLEILGETSARLAVPPLVGSRGKQGSVRYGNVPLLHRVFTDLVIPLHHDSGVERVEMGGLVDERPAA
ncbi:MAG: hypothetical protein H0T89_03440 [Deltaproteobacteria bacterium]|nr:hypothetical protein [Deltaproteobacteria bacterium]